MYSAGYTAIVLRDRKIEQALLAVVIKEGLGTVENTESLDGGLFHFLLCSP